MLRVGIVGCGRISDLHARGYIEHPDAAIVAVCDPDRHRALDRASRWGVPDRDVHTDLDELLARDDLDAVELLTPHHLHRDQTLAALATGRHVSVQKPMALSLDEADDMIAAADMSAGTLKVFENFVFLPAVRRARELIDAGEIGEVLSIRLKSNPGRSDTAWEIPASAWQWRFEPHRSGGGPLVWDDGWHKLAIAWYLMGAPPQRVHAFVGAQELAPGYVLDQPSLVSWTYADGRVGSLEAVLSPELEIRTEQYAQDDRVEVTGTAGVLWITQGHGRLLDVPPLILHRGRRTTGFQDLDTRWASSFVTAVADFVDSVRDGRTPVLTPRDARQILATALAVQESAATRAEVRVADTAP